MTNHHSISSVMFHRQFQRKTIGNGGNLVVYLLSQLPKLIVQCSFAKHWRHQRHPGRLYPLNLIPGGIRRHAVQEIPRQVRVPG